MNQSTEEDIRVRVIGIVLEMAPTAAAGADAKTALADGLGYHSLALLELAFALEDEFRLPPIEPRDAQSIRRVGDVQDYIVAQLRDRVEAEADR
jgi:acyl carrier protein